MMEGNRQGLDKAGAGDGMRRSKIWRGMVVALGLGAMMSAASVAEAAPGSRICRQIEAQLSSGGGSSKWVAAAGRQKSEITKVRRQMRAAGCGFFSSGGQCRALSAAASRMERNLASLQRGGGRSRSNASRGQLLAALDANNCRGDRQLVRREPGLFDRLLGASPRSSDTGYLAYADDGRNIVGGDRTNVRRARPDARSTPETPGFNTSQFRTFCVRTCDGYYFPMSPSSSRSDFARDAQNCQTACPGAEMQVYYHSGVQEDAAEMTSAANGRPYADMATAFLYRSDQPRDNACSCAGAQKPGGFSIIAGEPEKQQPETVAATGNAGQPALPLPRSRPDPASDPETLLNREGQFGPDAIKRLLSNETVANSDRKVRVVGPVFLPDPATAVDLRAPARTEVQ